MEKERLQKFMAECGIGSRRACEQMIADGKVAVNGKPAEIGCSVDPSRDRVTVDGKPVRRQTRNIVGILYKPKGVVCTSEDPEGRKTVQSYVSHIPERLYNVGRLDINSEGLLVMTNDGDLAYRMTHPKFEVEKTYYAICDGTLTDEQAEQLRRGVKLEDGMTAPARVEKIRRTAGGDTSFLITIHEGRNRQVRRMLEQVGHRTLRLKREKFGPFEIGDLQPGAFYLLTNEEIRSVKLWLKSVEKGN